MLTRIVQVGSKVRDLSLEVSKQLVISFTAVVFSVPSFASRLAACQKFGRIT